MKTDVTRHLMVKLAPHEADERAQELAAEHEKWVAAELKKAAETKRLKDIADGYKERMGDLARIVKNGEEERPVVCYEEGDHRRWVVELRRGDTHAIVESRAMRESERTQDMFASRPTERVMETEPKDEVQ